jgi:regulator of protease activity HflC (stomatin/prohibitin superfamily)
MSANLVVVVIFLIFIGIFLSRIIKVVPKSQKMIVSRLGRFHAVHDPGIAMLVPFIETGTFVDMERQNSDLKIDQVSIIENAPMNMTIQAGYSVVDPVKATFNVADYKSAIRKLIETHVRKICSEATLTDVLADRAKLQERIRESVNLSGQEWGLIVSDLVISFVDVPEEVQHELRRKAEAERLRRLMTE